MANVLDPQQLKDRLNIAPVSLRKSIEIDLRARVASGEWQLGVMLPGRKSLAGEYHVDLSTIQRAIAALVADGTLRADMRRGTFVGANPQEHAHPVGARPAATASNRTPPEARNVLVGIICPMECDAATGNMTPSPRKAATVRAVEQVVAARGGGSRFSACWDDGVSEINVRDVVANLAAGGVDGIVIVDDMPPQEVARLAVDVDVPILLVGGRLYRSDVMSVYYSSIDAGYRAAQHILSRGCDRLLYFEPIVSDWADDRLAGVRQAISDHGISSSVLSVFIGDERIEDIRHTRDSDGHLFASGYEAAKKAIGEGLRYDGIIAANDYYALGFLRAASESGFSAGDDFALIGFDDLDAARTSRLTTMRPPFEALGQEAASMITRSILGERGGLKVELRSELIVRDSTRAYSPRALPPGRA
ncbi:MAG: substrate-binding domain-containing protein [Capsulimonadaceae bacterium]|nr:substrate-binding domain-containing protein [Capsulimonadaceae bacterium]